MAGYRDDERRDLAFEDFIPAELKKSGIFNLAVHEPLAEVVARASEWIHQQMIDVVNVETIMMPGTAPDDPGARTEVTTYPIEGTRWRQFVRVWYWRRGQ